MNTKQVVLFGGGLLLLCAGQLGAMFFPAYSGWEAMALLTGALFVAISARQTSDVFAAFRSGETREATRTVRIRWWLLAVSIVIIIYVGWRAAMDKAEVTVWHLLLLWSLSIIALIIAVYSPEARHAIARHRRELVLIGILFAVAFLIRAANAGVEPHILDQDEAKFAWRGTEIRLNAYQENPFGWTFHSYPDVYAAFIGLSTQALGQTLLAARLPSVVLGALGVVAIYLLGREVFNWQVGLIGALFTLTWPFHLQFSQLALNQTGDAVFATLAFYFLLRGLRRDYVRDYVLCGVMTGLAQFFYLGGKLVPIVILLYLIVHLRKFKRQWLLIPLAASIVSFPYYYRLLIRHEAVTTHDEPYSMMYRSFAVQMESERLALPQVIARQIAKPLMAFIAEPDKMHWYGQTSVIEGPFGIIPFLVGCCVLLLMIRQYRRWLLPLLWLITGITLGSVLTIDPPQYQRYFPFVAAIALMIALGIWILAALAVKSLRLFSLERYTTPLAVSAGTLFCVLNFLFYSMLFVPTRTYLRQWSTWTMNKVGHEMAADYDKGKQVVLIHDQSAAVEDSPVVKYFMAGKAYTVAISLQELDKLEKNVPTVVYVSLNDYKYLDELKRRYPASTVRRVFLDVVKEDGGLAFYVVEVPRA